MALNFSECEEELQTLINKNRNDSKICQLLHDITFNYLYNVLKPGSHLYDYEMIAWDLAADIFLRIRNGANIQYFTNYIARTLNIYYLRQYEHENWSVIIDTTKDYDLEKGIQTGCVGIRENEYSKIENILTGIYFSQFESILTDIMKTTKFPFNSKERLNIQLSVLLTLIHNKLTYFRIEESSKPYINLIISQIKNKLIVEGVCEQDTPWEITNSVPYDTQSILD